jgi:hypothetical protein
MAPLQPGDEIAGCPAHCILKAVPAMLAFGFPRGLPILLSGPASSGAGFPARLAPCSPAMRLRVAPQLHLRQCRGKKLRGAPKLNPTGGTGWRTHQVALMLVPSGGSAAASCEFPRIPATAAGPMTTSHAVANFASSRLAQAADESSRRRVLHFPAKPWMRFRFPSLRRCRRTGCAALSSIESASSCLAGTAFQFPAGSPSGEDCRTDRSVETSAKRGKSCEYHQGWCINLWNSEQWTVDCGLGTVKK